MYRKSIVKRSTSAVVPVLLCAGCAEPDDRVAGLGGRGGRLPRMVGPSVDVIGRRSAEVRLRVPRSELRDQAASFAVIHRRDELSLAAERPSMRTAEMAASDRERVVSQQPAWELASPSRLLHERTAAGVTGGSYRHHISERRHVHGRQRTSMDESGAGGNRMSKEPIPSSLIRRYFPRSGAVFGSRQITPSHSDSKLLVSPSCHEATGKGAQADSRTQGSVTYTLRLSCSHGCNTDRRRALLRQAT